jgi:AraC-like DNA-binding protein
MNIDIFPPYKNLSEWFSKLNEHIGFEEAGENEKILLIPENLGRGKIWYREVINGMGIIIAEDLCVNKEMTINFKSDSLQPYYGIVCTNKMNGHAKLFAPDSGSETYFHQGAYLISSSIYESHTYKPRVIGDFTGLLILPEFIEKYLESLFNKKHLHINSQGKMEEVMLQLPSLNSEMQLAMNALRYNSYSGELRNLYLESKVFELITLFFLQFETNSNKKNYLRKAEKEKIVEAQLILKEKMDSPPSITKLSKLVGINEYKLRLGFKELSNNTVYGFLKQQRMLKAKALIENNELNVSEAGIAVGYSNLSHFAEAFKKEFGINPGSLIHH